MTYDVIIRNGRWFDGTGAPSAIRNLGIRDGHVVAVTPDDLDDTDCPTVIDASGKWVLPGMLDIHTHYDVEVLNGPSLSESLRHGVTTVMLGSCSLSTVYVDGEDAGDIFGRVEAIPRDHVIAAVDNHKTWTNGEEYIQALEARPLGPNVAAFIGHSDMRAATMGLDRATQKRERPSRVEQAQMERMLSEALAAGFVGMSSQQLLFDKLDGDVCRSRTLPSTYAKPRELRRLKSMLRRAGRVLQSGPDIQNPFNLGSQLVQSLGLFRNPLKTSLLSAADVKANPFAVLGMGPAAGLINRLGGNFRWQHLRRRSRCTRTGSTWSSSKSSARRRSAAPARRSRTQRNDARRVVPPPVPQAVRASSVCGFGIATSSTPNRRLPGPIGDREVVRSGRARARRPASGRCVPRSRARTRQGTALADRSPTTGPTCSRSSRAIPAYKWVSRMRVRTCATWRSTTWDFGCCVMCGTRNEAGKPFMTIEHAVHRLTGELAGLVPHRRRHLRIGDRADIVVVDPERLDSTLDDYAEETVEHYGGCRGWSTATRTPWRPYSSAGARFSSTASRPTSSVRNVQAASCAPRTECPRMHPSNRS